MIYPKQKLLLTQGGNDTCFGISQDPKMIQWDSIQHGWKTITSRFLSPDLIEQHFEILGKYITAIGYNLCLS